MIYHHISSVSKLSKLEKCLVCLRFNDVGIGYGSELGTQIRDGLESMKQQVTMQFREMNDVTLGQKGCGMVWACFVCHLWLL